MSPAWGMAMSLLMLSMVCGCSHPPDTGADNSFNPTPQDLPFGRQPGSSGVSPSQSPISRATRLPEGTPLLIRLQSPLSSASAKAGDTFLATLDEPIMIDGQKVIAGGAIATGRVVEVKAAGGSLNPGYLRIVLVSLKVGEKKVSMETSSVFAKAPTRDGQNPATSKPPSRAATGSGDNKDVVFGTDHRLNFHLAQAVEVP